MTTEVVFTTNAQIARLVHKHGICGEWRPAPKHRERFATREAARKFVAENISAWALLSIIECGRDVCDIVLGSPKHG